MNVLVPLKQRKKIMSNNSDSSDLSHQLGETMTDYIEHYIYVNGSYLWHVTGSASLIAQSMGAEIDRVEKIGRERENLFLKVDPSQQTVEQFCETFATAMSRVLEIEGYTYGQYRSGWDKGKSLLQERCRCLWRYHRRSKKRDLPQT